LVSKSETKENLPKNALHELQHLLSCGGDNPWFAGVAKCGELRSCPASLLNHMRQVHAPLNFKPTDSTTESRYFHTQALAVVPTTCFRGILGFFSPQQINWIERIVEHI